MSNPLGLPIVCGRTFQSFDLRLRACARPENHDGTHMPYALPGEPVPWGPEDEAREIAAERLREAIDEEEAECTCPPETGDGYAGGPPDPECAEHGRVA